MGCAYIQNGPAGVQDHARRVMAERKPNQRHLCYHFTVGNKLNSSEKEMGYIGRSYAGRACGRNGKWDSKTGFASFRVPFEFCDADGWALSSICGGSSEGP